MRARETGQVTGNAAEVYDEFFLPALFQQWAERVADAAGIQPGQRVLDVACGTGVLARAALDRVGPTGAVVGVDRNPAMLEVARRKAPTIEWQEGRAEALPLATNSFDVVVSQFGLMFFDHRRTALREMMRVLRPGGRLAVAVWDALDRTPGYAAMTGLLQRLFGDHMAAALRAPYVLGDPRQLHALCIWAGIPDARIITRDGNARFPSVYSWAYTDVKGWTLADALDDTQFSLLLREAPGALRRFVTADGTVEFSAPAHIITATKPLAPQARRRALVRRLLDRFGAYE